MFALQIARLAVPLRERGHVDLPGVGELRLRDGRVTLVRQTRALRDAFRRGERPDGELAASLWDAVHQGPVDIEGIGTFRIGLHAGYATHNPVDGSPIRVGPRLDLVLDGVTTDQSKKTSSHSDGSPLVSNEKLSR